MRLYLLLASATCLLLSSARARPQELPTSSSQSLIPLHTVAYTTALVAKPTIDVLCAKGEEWIDTVVVGVVMPREERRWPENGVTVAGAAVSEIPVKCGTKTMTWTTSEDLTWTLSGNSRAALSNGTTTTNQGSSPATGLTVTSEYTSIGSETSTLNNEVVGTSRPATIVRTGYTHIDFSHSAQNLQSDTSFVATSTGSYLRTTTMVQVTARPTGTAD